MRLLFLRGQVPSDRPVSQIMFDDLASNDDMWTQLAAAMVRLSGGYGELWYEKGKREVRYDASFVERWVKRYAKTECSFEPDVVFARGGFEFMTAEARRHPNAFKVYYGAGARAVPKAGGPWDLVLVDTVTQLNAASKRGYNASLFIKPAADNVFYPVRRVKQYDVIYVANYSKTVNKGHSFILPSLDALSTVHVGLSRAKWRGAYPKCTFAGWVPRCQMPVLYARSKVAVVWTRGQDSCPRVVPEALACNCPVLVGSSTKINFDLYVNERTGMTFDKSSFKDILADMLKRSDEFSPHAYYVERLSIRCSALDVLTKCKAAGCANISLHSSVDV